MLETGVVVNAVLATRLSAAAYRDLESVAADCPRPAQARLGDYKTHKYAFVGSHVEFDLTPQGSDKTTTYRKVRL
jgi:hypothetical protein